MLHCVAAICISWNQYKSAELANIFEMNRNGEKTKQQQQQKYFWENWWTHRRCGYVCVNVCFIEKEMLWDEDEENDKTDLRFSVWKRKDVARKAYVVRALIHAFIHSFLRSSRESIVQFHSQHYKYFFNNNLGNKMSHK